MNKLCLTIIVLMFVIVACTPSIQVSPTATSTMPPTPSSTPLPTATKIATHTQTPTPMPIIEVDGLKIPDPKALDPELFDLDDPNSPIVQFADALGIRPEDVGELTPKLITSADGKQYVVLTDKHGYPLMIAEQGVSQWQKITPDLAIKAIKGKESFAGASLGGSDIEIPQNMDAYIKSQFSGNTLEGWHWKYYEPNENGVSKDYQAWDRWMMNRYKGQIMTGHPVYFPANNPEWLRGKSDEELLKILKSHIQSIVKENGEINRWVVVNEPNESTFPDVYHRKFGDDIYLQMFQWAHEANPDAILILNDYNNDHLKNGANDNGNNTPKIQAVLAILKTDPEVYNYVHVGLQMHFTNESADMESMIKAIEQYSVPVDITEFTSTRPDKYEKIGTLVRKAENIKSVTFWGIGNTKKEKGITFYTDNQPNRPNQAYYDFLKGLLNSFN